MSGIDEDEARQVARAEHEDFQALNHQRNYPSYTPPPLPRAMPEIWGVSSRMNRARRQVRAYRLRGLKYSRLFAMQEASMSSYIEQMPVSMVDLAMVASHDVKYGERERENHMRRIADTLHDGNAWMVPMLPNSTGREADRDERQREDRGADLRETWDGLDALWLAFAKMRAGVSLDVEMLCDLHRQAFEGTARGRGRHAGELRTTQSLIYADGEVVRRATPPKDIAGAMANLAAYMQADDTGEHALTRAAAAHAQFEEIHPFDDGNGRVGRMLVQLMLCREGVLDEPNLPLSLCLNTQRDAYYRALGGLRSEEGWGDFVEFFVAAIGDAAAQMGQAQDCFFHGVSAEHRAITQLDPKPSATALEVHSRLARGEVLQVVSAARALDRSEIVVRRALQYWVGLGVAVALTDGERDVLYGHSAVLGLLNVEYTPPHQIIPLGSRPIPRPRPPLSRTWANRIELAGSAPR